MTSPSTYKNSLTATISAEGFEKLLDKAQERKYPGQHSLWTDDYRVELPVRIGKEGIATIAPSTMIWEWQ
jgi:hypothetical protein